MAIARRIFRKQYRRPKPRNTFTNNKVKPEINRTGATRKLLEFRKGARKAPLHKSLHIRDWNTLTTAAKWNEQVHAQRDIHVFAGHHTPRHAATAKEDTFQAYLPGEVWKKMSKQQRQEHLQKRNELIKKGVKFSRSQYKKIGYRAYFTGALNRPLLKNIPTATKMNYLKALIARAKMHAIRVHQEVEPEISRTAPSKMKISPTRRNLLNFRNTIKMNRPVEKMALIGRLTPKYPSRKKHG